MNRCQFCELEIPADGGTMCDNCWEAHKRIRDFPIEVLNRIVRDARTYWKSTAKPKGVT